jgi:hypothetical protein
MVPGMKHPRSLAEKWLWLGVAALAIAGIFAVILVVARTPQLKEIAVMQSLFNVALVVHVDLSVLMWFLAIFGMGVAGIMQPYALRWPYWAKAAFGTTVAATVLMALSPIDPEWEVIKSNYIPVLVNGVFFLSLGLLFAGMLALVLPMLITHCSRSRLRALGPVELGFVHAGLCVLLALAGFALSAHQMPRDLPHDVHFETLFWAGGHILQFAYALLMMAAWIGLLGAMEATLPKRGFISLTYLFATLGAVVSLAGFALYPFDSSDFSYHQTRVMIEFGGIGAGLLSLVVTWRALRHRVTRAHRAYASALISSLVLFAAGGVLGLMISGQNVGIPAHYHGQIVGITLALMGLAYAMLPRFGYASVAGGRLAFWQPIVYAIGQLMHIGGLAYSGGYGVLRKTAGGFEGLAPEVKAALGVMGLGGMIAIIGGILFVIVMLRAGQRPSASYQRAVV